MEAMSATDTFETIPVGSNFQLHDGFWMRKTDDDSAEMLDSESRYDVGASLYVSPIAHVTYWELP